ncbi:hypothetical protein GQ44DRAFT_162514 [Phaeosphaeriaceae sp. PMI808]|nr:hypothetical protein GQ44DRAFT_162514 [Phaeosphaeriaceae sp. PMI808]
MTTPHRGLPPPSAMTLPDPGRGPPSMSAPLGSLPPAPSQWQSDDGTKNWLAAKTEEERRRQEEEKTRQESLKLEQRKIEQSMLRESMQGGIPPHLIPIIFAGIGGGNLANISAEWIQQYTATVQAAHQHAQVQTQTQLSPDIRRDSRMLVQPSSSSYGGPPQTPQTVLPPTSVLPGQHLPAQPQQVSGAYGGLMSPRARAAQPVGALSAPTSAPRAMPQSQLPRLSTNDVSIQQPPTASGNAQQLQSQSTQQEQASPSIYFHHWVPPSSSSQEKSSSGNPPATPSGKYKASPVYQARQRATSHASDLEYTSSPKKRKAQGPHQPPPPPTSAPQSHTSPSFSHVSTSSASTPGRRGHARGRSDASARAPEASSAPVSRRGTVSGLAQEIMLRQSDFQGDGRQAEAKSQPHPDQAYAASTHRVDSHGQSQQSYVPRSKPETPSYESHQHWDRPYISPKREAGDH